MLFLASTLKITVERTENGQPIGVTVHSHCVENFKDIFQRYVGEGWVAVDCDFLLNILYVQETLLEKLVIGQNYQIT